MNKVAMLIFEGKRFDVQADYQKWIARNDIVIHFTSHSTTIYNNDITYSIIIFYSFKEQLDWLNK